MASKRVYIKDFYGKIIGMLDTDPKTGDVTARDFNGTILGFYRKSENQTKDFYGRILTIGDTTASLISQANENKK